MDSEKIKTRIYNLIQIVLLIWVIATLVYLLYIKYKSRTKYTTSDDRNIYCKFAMKNNKCDNTKIYNVGYSMVALFICFGITLVVF